MVLFVALLVGLPVIGSVLRRWTLLLLPLTAWPIYYIGLNQRWWGCCGTGEFWEMVAIALTIFGVATTAAAIRLGQAFASRFITRA